MVSDGVSPHLTCLIGAFYELIVFTVNLILPNAILTREENRIARAIARVRRSHFVEGGKEEFVA